MNVQRRQQQMDKLGALFSLSGDQSGEQENRGDGQKIASEVQVSAVKEGEKPSLDARIAHLEPLAQEDVRTMSAIMAGHPIRPWISEDLRNCGVAYDGIVKEQNWEILGKFRRIFYGPHHGIICEVFRDELVAAGKKFDVDHSDREFCPGQNQEN